MVCPLGQYTHNVRNSGRQRDIVEQKRPNARTQVATQASLAKQSLNLGSDLGNETTKRLQALIALNVQF